MAPAVFAKMTNSAIIDQFSTQKNVEPRSILPRKIRPSADLPQAGHPRAD
jgi:hypothetical protein